jgi:hypothetical protein
MSSAQFFVAKGLQELISHNLLGASQKERSDAEKEKLTQKHVQYFLRILGARIQPPQTGGQAESKTQQDHIRQLILKKISAQSDKQNKD